MDIEKQLADIITNGVHSERPSIDSCGQYWSVATEVWSPTFYSLHDIESTTGLVFCGELDGEYIFRSTV